MTTPIRRPARRHTRTGLAALLAFAISSAGCSAIYYPLVRLVYDRADLPASQIIHDASYDPLAADLKQRLDLFLPAGSRWPVVVFVHGGSWTSGDRALRVGGADVYGNIGRFLAGHGIGAAVISYRLLPGVDWSTQADDVAHAVGWVYRTIPVYGGDKNRIVLMGHSAGAQLAVRVALDRERLTRAGVPSHAIAGVIAVSGAGYDMTDEETYALGNDPAFYAERFKRNDADATWQAEASPIRLIGPDAPPFLIIYAGGETKPLQRQSHLLHEALRAAGVQTELLESPGLSHTRIVPTLSRDDRLAGGALLKFIERLGRASDP